MPLLLIFVAFFALLSPSVFAEMPLAARIDHAEAFAATPAPDAEAYNFKVGNLRTKVGATFEAEYNDNINQVSNGKLDDTIFRLGLKTKSVWPITELNALTLDLDMGYRFYLQHPEVDSNKNFLDINPGSELALKWWIRNFEFKAYDRFQYLVDSADTRVFNTATNTVQGGLVDFARFENRAGLQTVWDLNKIKVYGGYARDDVRAQKDEFKSIDRTAHTVYLSPLWLATPDFSVGLLSAYTWNNYRRHILNDAHSYALGPTVSWQVTQKTVASADVYFKRLNFEQTGTIGDTSDVSTINGHFRVAQELNDRLNHAVEFARDTGFGSVTNATTVTSVYYLPVYQLKANLAVKGRFGFENGKDSGSVNNENYDRRVYGAGLGYTLSKRLTTDLFYTYVVQTSDLPDRSHDQNRVVWDVNYDF